VKRQVLYEVPRYSLSLCPISDSYGDLNVSQL
jgi:hypothetical protein